jgi:hypothetical protein
LFNSKGLIAKAGGSIDLSILRSIFSKKEVFIPKAVFVRQEMIDVFNKLAFDRNNDDDIVGQVLIGAQGVGKSVLFLLVAIWQALQGNKVVYWRKTQALNENISVFVFDKDHKDGNKNEIDVRFNRSITKGNIRDMHDTWLSHEIGLGLYNQLTEDCFVFVDGPNHLALEDTFDGKAHYLCTSGGHPMPPPNTRLSKRLVVLGGWEKDTLRRAVEHVRSETLDDESFETVFYLTGGRIRDALDVARSAKAKSLYMEDYEAAVTMDSVTSSVLATTSTEGSAEKDSKDRWRTMFLSKRNIVFQVVDSGFKLALLAAKSNVDEMFKAYKLTVAAGIQTAAGCLFEELMHKWFFDTLPAPVLECLRGTGTGKESVTQLKEFLTYWVPSICNFANIDAALVDARKHLHCLQYTVQKSHKFDLHTLQLDMIGGIKEDQLTPITDIHIYFTTPEEVAFSAPVLASNGISYAGVTYHVHVVHIDVKSVASIGESCRKGFPFLDTATKKSATATA